MEKSRYPWVSFTILNVNQYYKKFHSNFKEKSSQELQKENCHPLAYPTLTEKCSRAYQAYAISKCYQKSECNNFGGKLKQQQKRQKTEKCEYEANWHLLLPYFLYLIFECILYASENLQPPATKTNKTNKLINWGILGDGQKLL